MKEVNIAIVCELVIVIALVVKSNYKREIIKYGKIGGVIDEN